MEALTHQCAGYRIEGAIPTVHRKGAEGDQARPYSRRAASVAGRQPAAERQHEAEAEVEYEKYLKLTNFDSKLAGQLNYYVIGSWSGWVNARKRRAARHLEGLAQPDLLRPVRFRAQATEIRYGDRLLRTGPQLFQRRSIRALRGGAFTGTPGIHQSQSGRTQLGHSAFTQVITINPDMQEAALAARNITAIQKFMAAEPKTRRANRSDPSLSSPSP